MNTEIVIKWVDPKTLKPSPDNPNDHTQEQIERLAEILLYQGFRSPIVVSNQTGNITTGHGRTLAAIHANMNQVPVSYQDFDDWDQEYSYIVADNAIAEWATLDLSKINTQIPNLGPIDINLFGLKSFEIEPMDKFDEKTGAKELDESEFSQFDHSCPKCGFEFDGK